MNPTYHIFFRPTGQRGSELQSITPMAYDESTGESIGYASGGFVRRLWDSMVLGANATGAMSHPDSHIPIEFASLQFGGHADAQGNGQGGITCQKWSKEHGLLKLNEPEPDIYLPRFTAEDVHDIPDQPEPPGISGVEAYAQEPVSPVEDTIAPPMEEPAPKKSSKKRVAEPKREETVSIE